VPGALNLLMDHDTAMVNSQMKRQRGRGRKPGGGHHNNYNPHQPNRTMESSGPDTKVRGPASHIYERYLQLARDAQSSGDRVLSENYLQHADHYFRLVRQMQPAMPPPQADRFSAEGEFESEEDVGAEGAEGADASEASGEGGEQPDREFAQSQQQPQQFERGEGEFRRRRGRRNRFQPGGGDEGGEPREGGERADLAERQERGERRERAPRERDSEPQEGFSNGPKPAFLRSE